MLISVQNRIKIEISKWQFKKNVLLKLSLQQSGQENNRTKEKKKKYVNNWRWFDAKINYLLIDFLFNTGQLNATVHKHTYLLQNCSVWITGRPEVKQTTHTSFCFILWNDLLVCCHNCFCWCKCSVWISVTKCRTHRTESASVPLCYCRSRCSMWQMCFYKMLIVL